MASSSSSPNIAQDSSVRPGPPTPQQRQHATSSPSGTPSRSNPVGQLTIEAALAAANGSHSAALEAVLAERNNLSAQNSQLWKLIEKQRAGYANVLKELERVKSERDRAFAKLDDRSGRRTKDRPSPSQSSPTSLHHERERTASTSRLPPHRHQSDSSGTQRNFPDTELPLLKTSEPLQLINGDDSTPSQQPSLDDSSALMPAPTPSTMLHPQAIPPQNLPSRKESIPHSTAPLQLRKSASDLHQSPPTLLTSVPATVPPGTSSENPLHSRSSPIQPTMSPVATYQSPIQQGPKQSLLGPYSRSDDSREGRESRITLPDEASHYIANMQDSPVPSPGKPSSDFSNTHSPLMPTVNGGQIDSPRRQAPSPSAPVSIASTPALILQPLDDNSEDSSPEQRKPKPIMHDPQSHIEFDDTDEEQNTRSVPSRDADLEDTPIAATQPRPPMPNTLANQSLLQEGFSDANQYDQRDREYLNASPSPSTQSLVFSTTVQRASPDEDEQKGANPQQFIHPQNLPAINPSSRPPYLSSAELPHAQVRISGSNIRANDRGKEVLSFVIDVIPQNKEPWKVEKLYSDVLALDAKIRTMLSRSQLKKISPLPDARLFKDNAPAKVDQRKAILEAFLQSLLSAPLKDNSDVCNFFSSDFVKDTRAPVTSSGYKEGYLTKRGKNFGGWKTRYFVLQSSVLEYYESRGGAHLGSITITGSQIGRQQKSSSTRDPDDENAYRHAFLIIEAKKSPSGSSTRHVLCAESDAERDSWVEVLVRYVVPNPEPMVPDNTATLPRTSMSSSANVPEPTSARRTRLLSKEEISKGVAVPISQLTTETHHPKLFPVAPPPQMYNADSSSSPIDRPPTATALTDAQMAQKLLQRGPTPNIDIPLSSSVPETSGLSHLSSKRSNSELGHYSDMKAPPSAQSVVFPTESSPVTVRPQRSSYHASLATGKSVPLASQPTPVDPTPDTSAPKKNISGPLNGMAIPPGYKFGAKDSGAVSDTSSSDRATKAKSGRFWPTFGRSPAGDKVSQALPVGGGTTAGGTKISMRVVFGVPIETSLAVAQVANLPAIVFRCIEYLEAKKAEQEEGIYRLSGSSAVVKNLRDRFNSEGDIDLLKDDEYWDPHAIAGLLKTFLRELPSSILTRDLHMRFLAVIDLMDPQERIAELASLIAALPPPNYSLLRALTAHLILIVQNASVNKMNMRNVGIVFSPTLGIPAGVFSLMLAEFNRVFNVDPDNSSTNDLPGTLEAPVAMYVPEVDQRLNRRNSQHYADGAADRMLGLSGRTLPSTADDSDEAEDSPIPEESDGEAETEEGDTTQTVESRSSDPSEASSPPTTPGPAAAYQPPEHYPPPTRVPSAKAVAQTRGLQIATASGPSLLTARRQSLNTLPTSPRPVRREPNPSMIPPTETASPR